MNKNTSLLLWSLRLFNESHILFEQVYINFVRRSSLAASTARFLFAFVGRATESSSGRLLSRTILQEVALAELDPLLLVAGGSPRSYSLILDALLDFL